MGKISLLKDSKKETERIHCKSFGVTFVQVYYEKESFSMNNMTTETMKETTRKVLGTALPFS